MENTEKVVYLDNAATTACAPEALAVMVEALSGACGNPSSHYSVGYEAKEFVDKGRAQVAKAINASPAEIFFTGCGSEADNWAVKGTAFTKARQNKKHLITSAFEHHAIMHSMAALERMGFEVTYIKPTTEGYIRPEDVDIVSEEKGMLKGVVTSVTFLGVHYEIIVDIGGIKWMIQTTDFVDVDEHIGLYIEPDAIHIMKKSEYSGMYGDYSSFSNELDELSDAESEPDE